MKFSPAFFQLKLFKSENLRVSSFGRSVAYLGLVARHLMRTEKTGDKCFFFVASFIRKANFSDFFSCSWLPCKTTHITETTMTFMEVRCGLMPQQGRQG